MYNDSLDQNELMFCLLEDHHVLESIDLQYLIRSIYIYIYKFFETLYAKISLVAASLIVDRLALVLLGP